MTGFWSVSCGLPNLSPVCNSRYSSLTREVVCDGSTLRCARHYNAQLAFTGHDWSLLATTGRHWPDWSSLATTGLHWPVALERLGTCTFTIAEFFYAQQNRGRILLGMRSSCTTFYVTDNRYKYICNNEICSNVVVRRNHSVSTGDSSTRVRTEPTSNEPLV
jgi:hypothetical protein